MGEERKEEQEARAVKQPEERERSREERARVPRGGLTVGLILIALGVILLLDNLFPQYSFGELWPVVIIVWGFAVMISSVIPPFDISRLFSGVFIGTVGVILLYNTLSIVPFSFWLDVIALWPVFLIAAGLAILGGVTRSKIIASLPSIIIVATLILAFLYSDALRTERGLTEFSSSQPVPAGVTRGSADIDFTVGSLRMGATDSLYVVSGKEARQRQPLVDVDRSGSRVDLNVTPRSDIPVFSIGRQRTLNVLLSRDIDWRVNVNTGVSDADLDLRDVRAQELDIDGGVGDITVRLGDKADRASVNINSGVSGLRVLVPKSVGLRMNLDRGLSSLTIDDIDLRRTGEDGVYETPNFDTAAKRIVLDADIGVSRFTVEGY